MQGAYGKIAVYAWPASIPKWKHSALSHSPPQIRVGSRVEPPLVGRWWRRLERNFWMGPFVLKPQKGFGQYARWLIRDGIDRICAFHGMVTVQVILLDKLVAPFSKTGSTTLLQPHSYIGEVLHCVYSMRRMKHTPRNEMLCFELSVSLFISWRGRADDILVPFTS